MCDHGRLNYRWMNRQDRVELPLVRHGGVLADADWDVALGAAAAAARGQARVRARVAESVERGAVPAVRLVAKTGGSGAFRVAAGRRSAAARRRGSRAARAIAPPTSTGAELLGFTRSDTPLAGLRRRRRAHRRRRRADATLDASTPRRRGAVDRDRHDAARVGCDTPRPSCCRSRTSPRRKARSRTCAAACSGSCRPRRRRASRGRAGSCSATCSRALGERTDYFARRPTCSPRSRRAMPEFAGLSLRHARAARAAGGRCGAAGGSDRMTISSPLLAGGPRRSRTRRYRSGRSSSSTVVKLIVVVHGLHGRRRAAHPGRAQDLGVDSGPARAESRRRTHGLLQPVADGVKNFMKEETYPAAREHAAVHARAGARVHSGADDVGGDSVRRAVGLAVGPDRRWSLAPICRSASCSSSRSRRSACTASCSPAGRRTTSTRCSAASARARR